MCVDAKYRYMSKNIQVYHINMLYIYIYLYMKAVALPTHWVPQVPSTETGPTPQLRSGVGDRR